MNQSGGHSGLQSDILYGKIVITHLPDDLICGPGQLSPPDVADVILGFFIHIFENSLMKYDPIDALSGKSRR
jgi:hypothetical protein